jgi:hypothetical protein
MKNPWLKEKQDTYQIRPLKDDCPSYGMTLTGHTITTNCEPVGLKGEYGWNMAKDHVWIVNASIVAKSYKGMDNDNFSAWEIKSTMSRDRSSGFPGATTSASCITTISNGCKTECPYIVTGMDGGFVIKVRGLANQTIKWVARINITGIKFETK